jgi:hypothetical protein
MDELAGAPYSCFGWTVVGVELLLGNARVLEIAAGNDFWSR